MEDEIKSSNSSYGHTVNTQRQKITRKAKTLTCFDCQVDISSRRCQCALARIEATVFQLGKRNVICD